MILAVLKMTVSKPRRFYSADPHSSSPTRPLGRGERADPVSCICLFSFLHIVHSFLHFLLLLITHLFESVEDVNEFFCVFSYCLVFCLTKKSPNPKAPKQASNLFGYYAFLLVCAQDHHLTEEHGAVGRLKFSKSYSILYDLNFYPMPVIT